MPDALQPRPIAVGIDIGGTGIKGGAVDLTTGDLLEKRLREPTPAPSAPDAVAKVVAGMVDRIPIIVAGQDGREARGRQCAHNERPQLEDLVRALGRVPDPPREPALVVPAELLNDAGVVGAACAAATATATGFGKAPGHEGTP